MHAQELAKLTDFDALAKKYKSIEPKLLAQILIDYPKEIKKRHHKEIDVLKNSEVLDRFSKRELTKDAVFEILAMIAQDIEVDYEKFRPMDKREIENLIKKIIKNNEGVPTNALIGKVMAELRGKAPGKEIVEIIKKINGN